MRRTASLRPALATVAAVMIAGGLALVGAPPALAATWTTITSPTTPYFADLNAGGPVPVTGSAGGADSVDVYCLRARPEGTVALPLANGVPVSNGTFSTTVTFNAPQPPCRLRALPTGTTPTGYVAPFTGPVVYFRQIVVQSSGATPYGDEITAGSGGAYTTVEDAGECGATSLASVTGYALYAGADPQACLVSIAEGRIPVSGNRTEGALTVDGHTAYLPSGVADLIAAGKITGTQSEYTRTTTFHLTGGLTSYESASLMRCAATDAYPPVAGSCSTLVDTGVQFDRTLSFIPASHELTFRDAFTSTDTSAHTVAVEYSHEVDAPPTGDVGYRFPGRTAFAAHGLGGTVSGIGSHGGTVLVRSDLHAAADDPDADTFALTWSRPPASIRFDPITSNTFGTDFSLAVPAGKAASLGFTVDERVSTAVVQAQAARALAALVAAPQITAPLAGARLRSRSITVRGSVAAGANGLPSRVTVNGVPATLAAIGPASARFSARVTVAGAGRHRLTVRASDVAGNARVAGVLVTTT